MTQVATITVDGHEVRDTLVSVSLRGNIAEYLYPMATNGMDDYRNSAECAACGRMFGYAKSGYSPITKGVRHMFDCENPNNW